MTKEQKQAISRDLVNRIEFLNDCMEIFRPTKEMDKEQVLVAEKYFNGMKEMVEWLKSINGNVFSIDE